MKRSHLLKVAAISMACTGLVAPQSAVLAAGNASAPKNNASATPAAVDLALQNGGLLRGKVVNEQGVAVKNATVSVWHQNQQIAKTVANENGEFAVQGLRGGVHYVVAGQGYTVYRLWTEQSAPPAAQRNATIVSGTQVMRAQGGVGETAAAVLTSPVLWGGIGYAAGHVVGFNQGLDKNGSYDQGFQDGFQAGLLSPASP